MLPPAEPVGHQFPAKVSRGRKRKRSDTTEATAAMLTS